MARALCCSVFQNGRGAHGRETRVVASPGRFIAAAKLGQLVPTFQLVQTIAGMDIFFRCFHIASQKISDLWAAAAIGERYPVGTAPRHAFNHHAPFSYTHDLWVA